jgi:1-aminocyclopropane-1-carboxylate deaminase/D-cysteine desulfhydrase-like pyridoxal-dependent ACC family enzyme
MPSTLSSDDLTPVELRGNYWFKRDDLFHLQGNPEANGGKVRTMIRLAKGAKGLVVSGDRLSTQIPRGAITAQLLGLPCRVHTASGDITPGMRRALDAGAQIFQHTPGYLTVVKKRAHDDAIQTGFTEVPWAVVCPETIATMCQQVANLPEAAKRIVVCVGSGMSLSAILQGMMSCGIKTPVLGVAVGGAGWGKRLQTWAPEGWSNQAEIVEAGYDYHTPFDGPGWLEGVELDRYYEAKCIPFLLPGDCLWIVGTRPQL